LGKKSVWVYLALLATGSLIEACGDGEVSATTRSSDRQAVNWWQQVAEPDATNTGPNCAAAHCPSATLTDIGPCPDINESYARGLTDRTLENFECTGRIRIQTNNVTLRNFLVNVSGGAEGIRMDGSVSGNLLEYGHIDGSGDGECNEVIRGRGFTGRYLRAHSCADVMKIGDLGAGPLLIEHSWFYDANGGHGDTFQVWGDLDSSVTIRHNALQCSPTTSCLISTSTVGATITFDENWIYGNDVAQAIRCRWESGDVGPPAIYVTNNLFDRGYRGLHDGHIDDCEWTGNLFMDTLTPAN